MSETRTPKIFIFVNNMMGREPLGIAIAEDGTPLAHPECAAALALANAKRRTHHRSPPMPSASPQRAAARRETPRLRWRTMDNGWATTTAEGWEYRIRYVQCGFSTDAQQSDGSWICIAPIRATLQQAKFCAFSNARWRRTEMEAPNVR